MAVTGLSIYSGDLVLGFLTRFGGSCAGLVLGMLIWYVGNAKGSNPYGTTAAMVVFVSPVVFWRIITKPTDIWFGFILMMAATTTLIVGYSWIDSHLVMVSNSGVGVHVAWKRVLLVVIGFTAAFIISLFPKPSSARKIVRTRAAKIIDRLSELYMVEMREFLIEAKSEGSLHDEHDMDERVARYRTKLLKIVVSPPCWSDLAFDLALIIFCISFPSGTDRVD